MCGKRSCFKEKYLVIGVEGFEVGCFGVTSRSFRFLARLKAFSVQDRLPHMSPFYSSSTIETPKGNVYVTGHFSCITEHVVYCLSCTKCPSIVYIGETGRRLADRFREHRRDIINGRNDLPVPAHFNQPSHTLEDMKGRPSQPGIP